MDWSSAASTITQALSDAGGVMAAIIGVVAAFWAFRKVKSLISR